MEGPPKPPPNMFIMLAKLLKSGAAAPLAPGVVDGGLAPGCAPVQIQFLFMN